MPIAPTSKHEYRSTRWLRSFPADLNERAAVAALTTAFYLVPPKKRASGAWNRSPTFGRFGMRVRSETSSEPYAVRVSGADSFVE
jgi:hypothetical protein